MSKFEYYAQKYRFRIIIILILILFILTPTVFYLFFNLFYTNKSFPNIYVNSISVGTKTQAQLLDLLTNKVQISQNQEIRFQKQTFLINSQEININIDASKTATTVMDIGRTDNPILNAKKRINLLTDKRTISYDLMWDEEALKQAVASIAATLNEPGIPPTIDILSLGGQKIATVSAGRSGRTVDELRVKEMILENYANGSQNSIDIEFLPGKEPVSDEKLEQTRNFAQKLFGKSVVLEFEKDIWDLNDEAMINFLSIYDTFDDDKIASWSGMLANTINREPQNALFNFDGDRVTEFKPAKAGISIDEIKTVESIKNGIQFLSNSQDSSYKFVIPVSKTEPKISTDKVNDLGIKELIGTGESWFYHSIATRIHNLTLASSKLHGVLIPPGEEFSMLKNLGEIDAAHGYKPAYIIQNGRTILGDGGGVCQASTTMFRAALDAGVEIKTRFPHAYRVSYYENNFDIGVDASIFSPTADFTFINDTPGHILIQITVDPKAMYLKYEFYGTNDGRVVERSKSRMWDQAPPPPDLFQDDPTLAPGVVKQVDWAAWGAKTAFDWKVTRNGETIHEKTFYSTYRPWQAVYLRGPQQ